MIANFDTSGDRIFVGNSVGEITVLETSTLKQLKK
jgi:hypothetical protein